MEPYPNVQIDGLAQPLIPYAYTEDDDPYGEGDDVSDRPLIITLRVRLSPDEGAAFRKRWIAVRQVGDYFNVTRVGIDGSPREMRFGQPTWSQHPDHEKYELVLVDRSYDRPGGEGNFSSPQERNESRLLIDLAEQVNALLDLLVERGRLSRQDIDGVRAVSAEARLSRVLDLRKTEDLDNERWLT